MALNSSNSNAGSTETKVGAGALSNFNTQKTESKSNGNFSGGDINFDASKLSINNPLNTNEPKQPTFNIDDVFTPTVSGNLDIDLPKTNNNNNSNTTYSNNSSEPTMTVDEVYGKSSNQPVVEKQGDYSVSSNEKSKVETSTFGKQDTISVTPTSVTENKGLIGNGAIQSVEGLDFQQKDKASQEVLDSKKKRDEAESEDKANSMRDKLKASVDKASQQEGSEDFRIGTSEAEKAFNKENAKRQKQLQQKKKAAEDATNKYKKIKQDYEQKEQELDETRKNILSFLDEMNNIDNEFNALIDKLLKQPANGRDQRQYRDARIKKAEEDYKQKIINTSLKYNFNIELKETDSLYFPGEVNNEVGNLLIQKEEELNTLAEEVRKASKEWYNAGKDYDIWKEDYDAWKKEQEANLKTGATPKPQPTTEPTPEPQPTTEPTPESQPTPQSGAETSHKDAIDSIENSENATPEQKAQAEEVLTNLENSRQELAEAAKKARSGNPADLVAYQDATEKYIKNLEEAKKIGNRFTQTDFNKDYTKAVANANDFRVTLADGTEMEYSDFATEEVTKSPQYAKAMYEEKAAKLEKEHPILAKIERWKAKMSQTWLGSKLTFADNKVRDQFTQMAKTDMRATYATYDNVLNDPDATPEQKEEASKAINQAKALMTASAALQASTGFLSGIGDSMDDGIYGTTDPGARNAWQKTLNTVDNLCKITLGLGISPAANRAYQNMYYMAGDKVNNSLLFNKDFDGDGFALCQEYGNNAATGMIAGAGELAVGVAMMFNPSSAASGLNLIVDSVNTFLNGLYGVRNEVEKSQKYTQEVLEYFKDAEDIAESSGNEEAVQEITNAITQIENFELKADEVGNLDNWLEGSGSNTVSNEKFNQALTYDEWMKLIEADPTMQEYAKKLIAEKKKEENAKKDNADTRVNS